MVRVDTKAGGTPVHLAPVSPALSPPGGSPPDSSSSGRLWGSGEQAHSIIHATYGKGPALAVVMAPVMPWWDEGRFFAPITERLVALGYKVMIFDSLSLEIPFGQADDLTTFTQAWRHILQGLGPLQLLAGSALGGAVVQGLLGSRWGRGIPAALLVSAPTAADARLDQRLGLMAQLARDGELQLALEFLDRWILPEGQAPLPTALPEKDLAQAGRRLTRGFGYLHGIDLRNAVQDYPGQLLSLYGEQSQLVRAANVSFARSPKHLAVSIASSGMRPHLDEPALVWASIREQLRLGAQVGL